LADAPTEDDPIFGLAIPRQVSGVPSEILLPEKTWSDPAAYRAAAEKLAALFNQNFGQYASAAGPAVKAAGPRVAHAARV
jgi:phosphoenolpyruvate carboxykinase (ATP)